MIKSDVLPESRFASVIIQLKVGNKISLFSVVGLSWIRLYYQKIFADLHVQGYLKNWD